MRYSATGIPAQRKVDVARKILVARAGAGGGIAGGIESAPPVVLGEVLGINVKTEAPGAAERGEGQGDRAVVFRVSAGELRRGIGPGAPLRAEPGSRADGRTAGQIDDGKEMARAERKEEG